MPSFDVVIPSTGRASLGRLVESLGAGDGPAPERVIVVDDRRGAGEPLAVAGAEVIRPPRPGAGPAAARNAGWRAATAPWVAFLDDDVVPGADWRAGLAADLNALAPEMAGTQGRIRVPLSADRRPTDWERNVAGLESAAWATADMAFRRAALEEVDGFDERFPRAYREDADLALRLRAAGWSLERGRRTVEHPVGHAGRWVSVRKQAGNADDVLMRAEHGRRWRERARAPRGRLRAHLAITAAGLAALAAIPFSPALALALGALWLAGTAELAWRRIAPGPRTPGEVATMVMTSVLIPLAATVWWAWGHVRQRRRPAPLPAAVLLDRDGTLLLDVPYNGDPERVRPMAGAREALDRLRAARVPLAVVSNQSGVARGLLTAEQVAAVNRRAEELLGPLGPWLVCPHAPEDGCGCRKPAPGLVLRAAASLGVQPGRCVVIGDIGADVEAARAAGARAILVPTPQTRPAEVSAAPEVAADLAGAVDLVLGGRR